jgi:hypothetical protein
MHQASKASLHQGRSTNDAIADGTSLDAPADVKFRLTLAEKSVEAFDG